MTWVEACGMTLLVAIWLLVAWRTTPAGRARSLWLAIGLLGLLARFAATMLILGNHGDTAGTDGLIYHKVAMDVMKQLRTGTPVWRVSYSYTWYTLVLGIQYAITGANRFLGCYMNAFYAALTAQVLLRICLLQAFSLRKSLLIAGAWLFMPSLVVWTADTRKEGISLLLAMLLWWMVLLVLKRTSRMRSSIMLLTGGCLLLWISTVLRLYMLFPLGLGVLTTLLLRWAQTRRRDLLVCCALVLSTMLLFSATSLMPQMEGNHALGVDRTEGGDEDLSAEYLSVLHMLREKDLPTAINGFFTEPHPENIRGISDLQGQPLAMAAVLLEMLLWYLLMLLAVFGMMEATLRLDAFLLGMLVFILLYSGINILLAENISDTYYRYRAFIIAPVMLFADPTAMLGLFRRKSQESVDRLDA